MVLGGGSYEYKVSMNGLIIETQRSPSPLLPCEDVVRKELSVNQKASPSQTLNLLTP
jgi:hypothetical protein